MDVFLIYKSTLSESECYLGSLVAINGLCLLNKWKQISKHISAIDKHMGDITIIVMYVLACVNPS